jgi:hypothetical protein
MLIAEHVTTRFLHDLKRAVFSFSLAIFVIVFSTKSWENLTNFFYFGEKNHQIFLITNLEDEKQANKQTNLAMHLVMILISP